MLLPSIEDLSVICCVVTHAGFRHSYSGCCIYHKSKAFGESDSDESDSDTEKAKAQPNKGRHPNYQRHHA